MNYTISKNHFVGWKAETEVKLGDDQVLTITTSRRSNGNLMTIATVGTLKGMFINHLMYSDYNKAIATSTPKRITQKVVEAQHNQINLGDIIADANYFYENKK